MTTYEALLAAVHAAPDDDLPRLVLADHYEGELGMPERGEFIRVQLELAKLGDCRGYKNSVWPYHGGRCGLSHCPFCNLVTREKQLAYDHGYLWFPGVHRHLRAAPDLAEWPLGIIRRGFLEVVRGPMVSLMVPGVLRGRDVMPLRVDVTDRKPHHYPDGWSWWRGSGDPDSVPPHAYDLLKGGTPIFSRTDARHEIGRVYPTPKSAKDALSGAVLSWARGDEITVG